MHEPKNLNLFNPQNIPTCNPSFKHVSNLIKPILLLPKRNTIIFIFILFFKFWFYYYSFQFQLFFLFFYPSLNFLACFLLIFSTCSLLTLLLILVSTKLEAQVTKEKCKREWKCSIGKNEKGVSSSYRVWLGERSC